MMMIEIAFTLAYKNVRAVFFVFSSFALFEQDTVPLDVTLYAKWTKEISPSAKAAFANGYQFSKWSDGNTNVKRTITVKYEATYTAYTKVIPYTISYNLNGGVSGG